jgi:hypothetical protein
MVGFPGFARSGATLATLMVLAAGCATGRGHTAPAGPARSPRPGPVPSATGYVKRADFLAGVDCLASGTCAAVGWYYYGAAGPGRTLAVRWNGRAWLAEPAPGRGREDLLEGVSCATASACLAVGSLADAATGTGWSAIPAPPGGAMSSVSCPAPGSCQAVGLLPPGDRPVAARWNGRAWQAERVPPPRPAQQTLNLAAVSCPAASFCLAVGDDSHGAKAMPSASYRDRTLVERWNGTRWRILRAPSPTHASRLTGVSCTSPTACVAVGSSANGARTLAERWNGARWTVQRTPDLGHVGYSALAAVSCATAASCMAVGTYNGGVLGIAERWDGARWTIRRLAVPPGPAGGEPSVVPVSVSCTSATACVTVGTTQNQTMAERWNGSTWAIEHTPDPA